MNTYALEDISDTESEWSLRTIDEARSTLSHEDEDDSRILLKLYNQIGGQVYPEEDEITTNLLDYYFTILNPTSTYI